MALPNLDASAMGQEAHVVMAFRDGSEMIFDAYITELNTTVESMDVSTLGGAQERIPSGRLTVDLSLRTLDQIEITDPAGGGVVVDTEAARLLRRVDA